MKRTGWRLPLAFLLCLCWLGTADAQTRAAPTYAVMSLVGDNLPLIIYTGTDTGPGIKVQQKGYFDNPIKSNIFDAMTLNVMAEGVRKLRPDAATDVLQTRNTTLLRMQDRIFDAGSDAAQKVRNSLKTLLADQKATQLILLTKHRDEVELPLASGAAGVGVLEGLGFYVDNTVRLRNASGNVGFGVIGAYAFMTLRLVDAKTMNVIREIPLTTYRALPRTSEHPEDQTWEKLTDRQKADFIQDLVTDPLSTAMPKLLAPAS
jgi:hypothetical protein